MGDVVVRKPRGRPRGRPFTKGESGNPAGRRRGNRNRASLAAEILLDGEAEALTRKAVELALSGDAVALRLCLDRILAPCRDRPVRFDLQPITSPGDITPAICSVTTALAEGVITPSEAAAIAQVIIGFVRATEIGDVDWQLRWAEAMRIVSSHYPD